MLALVAVLFCVIVNNHLVLRVQILNNFFDPTKFDFGRINKYEHIL